MAKEITLAIIKPNATEKKATGKIIDMILGAGFEIKGMKMLHLTKKDAERFYEVHKERPFFNDLTNFMSSGPIVVMALEKENAVEDCRKLIGATNPAEAAEGTVRKLFGENIERNAVHGSDSPENGVKEVGFFFSGMELI
jgi:nucleoside-diphosphate kinase